MKLAHVACVLALAGCAATPKAGRAYELRTTVYEMPTELAQSLTGEAGSGGFPAPASLMDRAAEAAHSRSDVETSSRPMIIVREGGTAEISKLSGMEDGLAFEIRPRAREAQLELEFRAKRCQLAGWSEGSERTESNGERVKLKYPIVAKHELHSRATLAQGECLAVMLSTANPRRTALVCVSAVAAAGDR